MSLLHSLYFMLLFLVGCFNRNEDSFVQSTINRVAGTTKDSIPVKEEVDSFAYRKRTQLLAGSSRKHLWPVQDPVPKSGAVLPFKRVIAFYGNFYSTRMGVLGQYPKDEMLAKLHKQVSEWDKADSLISAIPALHYIAVTAQASPGQSGTYRLRMPAREIKKAIDWAQELNGLVFLDVQVGLSNLQTELPLLKPYLKLAEVHLGIDPEFSMKSGKRPGTSIGTYDADDINYAIEFLKQIVIENQLPPKILVIHRFTQKMLTNYKRIKLCPEVQVVINMDGFGSPAKKKGTYQYFIYQQPVQFTGFKVFYKNDLVTGGRVMRPEEILKLNPIPIYIQYQ